MKKTTINLFFIALALSFIVVGCKKDEKKEEDKDKKVEQNGLTPEINQMVPDSILTFMVELGMPINRGGAPADIKGQFMVKPFILKATNIKSDVIGTEFADYLVTFYDLDNENLSIKLDYINGPESGNGVGGFIVGTEDNFSIFAEVASTNSGTNATLVHVISGVMKEDGIHDFYFANFMIDNQGNPNNIWIANGEGRVLYDSDGLSERVVETKRIRHELFNGQGVSSSIK